MRQSVQWENLQKCEKNHWVTNEITRSWNFAIRVFSPKKRKKTWNRSQFTWCMLSIDDIVFRLHCKWCYPFHKLYKCVNLGEISGLWNYKNILVLVMLIVQLAISASITQNWCLAPLDWLSYILKFRQQPIYYLRPILLLWFSVTIATLQQAISICVISMHVGNWRSARWNFKSYCRNVYHLLIINELVVDLATICRVNIG